LFHTYLKQFVSDTTSLERSIYSKQANSDDIMIGGQHLINRTASGPRFPEMLRAE